jgi:RNA-directed DNA polymerase
MIIVRFADDIVLGFQEKSDADHRQWRGEGKPETFNFLGFRHICVKKRSNGRFKVLRQTIRKRLQAKLNQVKDEASAAHARTHPRTG